ncbi:hypothetical protein NDU88_007598 [Pleurodeles waltl]|uniref:Uncharacterized protein n=1 Tax=Pleurodeles waltl TaxID=8319 RepID=A0AAV7WHK6_PLEWA|nr:hypothetical protein NDU88_007598 [Pleurodeles waltl]
MRLREARGGQTGDTLQRTVCLQSWVQQVRGSADLKRNFTVGVGKGARLAVPRKPRLTGSVLPLRGKPRCPRSRAAPSASSPAGCHSASGPRRK